MPPLRLFTASALVLAIASVVVGFLVLTWWLVAGSVPNFATRIAMAVPTAAAFSAVYLWTPELYRRSDRLSSVLAWLNCVGIVLGWTGVLVVAVTTNWRWAVATIFAGLVAGVSFVLRENFR